VRRRANLIREQYDPEWQKQFISPIPPHLSPQEREIWEKELEWERQEHERRKKEGFYPYEN